MPQELWNIAGGPQKLINFILKFYLYLPKESNVKERERLLLTYCLLVMEFRFDAMLCSNLGNKNSDAGHIKCSRGPQIPQPELS